MKKYFNVSFQYSGSVYCSNLAHAETVEDVQAHYSEYDWVSVSDATEYDVRNAQERGKPIIECERVEPTQDATDTETETDTTTTDTETTEGQEIDETAEALAVIESARAAIAADPGRSAWSRGVAQYADELLAELAEAVEGGYFFPDDLAAPKVLEKGLLNGASDWSQYSWGGCSLIYDGDIAERLCCPSELKRTRNGECRPNSREEWLDTQARALYQAARRVRRAIRETLEAKEV